MLVESSFAVVLEGAAEIVDETGEDGLLEDVRETDAVKEAVEEAPVEVVAAGVAFEVVAKTAVAVFEVVTEEIVVAAAEFVSEAEFESELLEFVGETGIVGMPDVADKAEEAAVEAVCRDVVVEVAFEESVEIEVAVSIVVEDIVVAAVELETTVETATVLEFVGETGAVEMLDVVRGAVVEEGVRAAFDAVGGAVVEEGVRAAFDAVGRYEDVSDVVGGETEEVVGEKVVVADIVEVVGETVVGATELGAAVVGVAVVETARQVPSIRPLTGGE